jgi:hypothetical protein
MPITRSVPASEITMRNRHRLALAAILALLSAPATRRP